MNRLRQVGRSVGLALGLWVAAALPTWATGGHTPENQSVVAQATAAVDLADGEVRRIDKDGGRVTLRHGEIKNLDMPPMTMVFSVADKGWLDQLKTGDKVKFRAVNDAGKFTVIELQVVR